MPEANDLPRKIGFWGGSAIMVGIIVGTGIFATPPVIAREMGSPALIVLLWVAGGVLSLFGAFAYAELATMFPRSGGIYVYLHEGFGGWISFVFGWTYLILAKPLAAAGITLTFANHFNMLFGLSWRPEFVTCAALLLLTLVNVIGVRLGARVAMVLTGAKVLALAAIVVLGVVLAKGAAANFSAVPRSGTMLRALPPVLYGILWTYDGWSDVAAIAGEVENPRKNLPRILLFGTAATIALYVAVNAVYIAMVPLDDMRGTDTVAPAVMHRLLGPAGATAVTALIMLSSLGSSHAAGLTGARVTFAQARDGLLFRFLGHIHPRVQTPDVSLWVQGVLGCVAVLVLRDFQRLAGGFTFTMWIFYGLGAAAVIVLRVKRPGAERPYKCWGYPVIPAVFILAAVGMTTLEIARAPKETLPWLGVFAAGVPAYWIWRRLERESR